MSSNENLFEHIPLNYYENLNNTIDNILIVFIIIFSILLLSICIIYAKKYKHYLNLSYKKQEPLPMNTITIVISPDGYVQSIQQ